MFRKPALVAFLIGILLTAAVLMTMENLAGGTRPPSPQRRVDQPLRRTPLQIAQAKPLGEPIAYGTSSGKGGNSGNCSCTFENGVYHISIAGVRDYDPERYLLFVTPLNPYPHWMIYWTQQEKDGPSIFFSNKTDTGVSLFFQFIIYRMPD